MRAHHTRSKLASYEPYLRSILRIVAAFMFLLHGTQKLFAFPAAAGGGTAELGSLMWFAGVLELVGGALLLVGLFTRPVAFVLAGQMAVAYFMAHAPQSFWPTVNQGEPAVLYCFLWLYFFVAGAGAISLDRLRDRGEAHPVAPH
jgi:putative oxidoreductase